MLGRQLTGNIHSKEWGRTVRGWCASLGGSGKHLKCNQINLDFEKPKQDKRPPTDGSHEEAFPIIPLL